jgi:hypothetical protein
MMRKLAMAQFIPDAMTLHAQSCHEYAGERGHSAWKE